MGTRSEEQRDRDRVLESPELRKTLEAITQHIEDLFGPRDERPQENDVRDEYIDAVVSWKLGKTRTLPDPSNYGTLVERQRTEATERKS